MFGFSLSSSLYLDSIGRLNFRKDADLMLNVLRNYFTAVVF